MQLFLTRAKMFAQPNPIGKSSMLTLGPGQNTAPDWVRETGTYKAGIADGSIQDHTVPVAQPGILIPTVEQLMAIGYARAAAEKTVQEQQVLAAKMAFVASKPADVPVETEPAVQQEAPPAPLASTFGLAAPPPAKPTQRNARKK